MFMQLDKADRLCSAAFYGITKSVRALLGNDYEVNDLGRMISPIGAPPEGFVCAIYWEPGIGPAIEAPWAFSNHTGPLKTPLTAALRASHESIARILLEAGANANIPNKRLDLPLRSRP